MRTIEWRTKVGTPLGYNFLTSFRQRRWKHQLIFDLVFCSFHSCHFSCVLFKTCFQLLSSRNHFYIWLSSTADFASSCKDSSNRRHPLLTLVYVALKHSTQFTNNRAERTSFLFAANAFWYSILIQELAAHNGPAFRSILLVRVRRTKPSVRN